MLKNIFIVIGSVIIGAVIIFLVEALGHMIYPPPEGIDFNDSEAMKSVVSNLPVGALLFVVIAYALGSFGGGFASVLISKQQNTTLPIIIGIILMIFGIINLFLIPHPVWFMIANLLVYIPFAYF